MYFWGFLVEHLLTSQEVVVVLGEAVGFVSDVLQQLASRRMGGQLYWFGACLQENLLLFLGY